MKIAVIGANGRTGRAFVNAALEAGHDIRAGVHSTEVFKSSDHLEVHRIDALKSNDVDKLLVGCDAVVSLIGHVKGSPAFLQTTAIGNILSAMKRHHVRRLVSLTGTGVRLAGDTPSISDRCMNMAVMLLDPDRVRDGRAHADVVRESSVDWSIIRVLKLTNGREQPFVLTLGGPAKTFVSRRTVAEAILVVLSDKTLQGSMPVLSNR